MSEVKDKYGNTKTKYCRVHDLLHDLATEKAKEDNFLTVCSKPDEIKSCGDARRLAVHHSDIDGLVKHASSNLRTLLCFNASQLPNGSKHKLLKVLRVEPSWNKEVLIAGDENIGTFTQLRYLQLDSLAEIDDSLFCKWINGMKFLQALGITCLDGYDLSDFTWEIETLRYVKLIESFGPPPGTSLRNLRTLLGDVKNRESWEITALPYMPNLCSLELDITEGFAWEVVVVFLRTLNSLVHLYLNGSDIPIEVIDMRDFPFYQQLTYLKMRDLGLRKGVVNAAMFPTHLSVLKLFYHVIEEDPMALLEKLLYLESLKLYVLESVEDVKQIKCSTGGFPRLRTMIFNGDDINLEKWEIEEGAIPMLKA